MGQVPSLNLVLTPWLSADKCMVEKTSSVDNSLDWLKWLIVIVLVALGIYGNSYFSSESLLYRTIGLLVLASVAGWIGAQTKKGSSFVTLCLEARTEIRKVVWPTRQETTQTTMIVLIVVLLVATLLWVLDWGLTQIISAIIG